MSDTKAKQDWTDRVVNRTAAAGPKLAWKAPAVVAANDAGGHMVWPENLADWVENPDGIELVFDPNGGMLTLGRNTLSMVAKDAAAHGGQPITCTVTVTEGVVWTPPARVESNDVEGYFIDDALMNARSVLPGNAVRYNAGGKKVLPGQLFEEGTHTLTVLVGDGFSKSHEFRVALTAEHKEGRKQKALEDARAAKRKGDAPVAVAEPKSRPPADPVEKQAVDDAFAQHAKDEAAKAQKSSVEYPFGAANVVPHIHHYAKGFHLKTAEQPPRRLNLYQNNTLYKGGIEEAKRYATAYDEQNKYGGSQSFLLATLEGLLKAVGG